MAVASLVSTAASAGVLDGIGVVGDSDSVEYQFTADAGDTARTSARSWVELLAAERAWNFGEFTTEDLGTPRFQGYAYDWARGGDTANGDRVGRDLPAQLEGLLPQVAAGDVTLAVIYLGANDIGFADSGTGRYTAIHNGELVGDELDFFLQGVTGSIEYAVDKLQSAGDVKIVLANVPNVSDWPRLNGLTNAAGVQRVENAVEIVNQRIQTIADRRSIPVVDIYELYALSRQDSLVVGDVPVNTSGASSNLRSNPTDFYVDGVHPNTVVSGLIANSFVAAVNRAYGTQVQPLRDQQIWNAAETAANVDVEYDSSQQTYYSVDDFVHFNPTPDRLVQLIAGGDMWKFWRGTQEPSASPLAWTTTAFNDSEWESGISGFGTGSEQDLRGVQTQLDDAPGNYSTLYLRHEFTVLDPRQIEELNLQMGFNDHFVAYINGVEVLRSPFGTVNEPVPFDAATRVSSRAAARQMFVDLSTMPDLLRAGDDNVLSIQIVNRRLADSSLIATELGLVAVVPEPDPATGLWIALASCAIWRRSGRAE